MKKWLSAKMSNNSVRVAVDEKQNGSRVAWVDAVKLFACLLVVFGHLYMSMVSSGLLDENNPWYQLPIQTIYSFHVPLFFVCSGFLYLLNKGGSTPGGHIRSLKKKALSLGVPYVTFSTLTLLLKNVFSSEVNNQATPFVRTLLFEPIAPYWYLYTLFLLFCLIPRLGDFKKTFRLFIVAFAIKIIYVLCPYCWSLPDLVQKIAACGVWFVFGMLLSDDSIRRKFLNFNVGLAAAIAALIISFSNYRVENPDRGLQFLIAALFVYSIIAIAVNAKELQKHAPFLSKLGCFFMPVYVLHTICAAGIRSILLKLGIDSLCANMIIGLAVSIAAPMMVYQISLSHWAMLFFFEPVKALKLREGCK